MDHFQDGVFFVDLAPINDYRLVLSRITQVLDLKEAPGQSLIDTLTHHLHDKKLLLLLDNFEQVIEGAPLVCDLLSACPGLIIVRNWSHCSGKQLRMRCGDSRLYWAKLVS
jgi:predicted ATPase